MCLKYGSHKVRNGIDLMKAGKKRPEGARALTAGREA